MEAFVGGIYVAYGLHAKLAAPGTFLSDQDSYEHSLSAAVRSVMIELHDDMMF